MNSDREAAFSARSHTPVGGDKDWQAVLLSRGRGSFVRHAEFCHFAKGIWDPVKGFTCKAEREEESSGGQPQAEAKDCVRLPT